MSTKNTTNLHLDAIDAHEKGLWVLASRQSSNTTTLKDWISKTLTQAAREQLGVAATSPGMLNPADFTLLKSGLSDAKGWWTDETYDLFVSQAGDELHVFQEPERKRIVYQALYYFDEFEHVKESDFIHRLYAAKS